MWSVVFLFPTSNRWNYQCSTRDTERGCSSTWFSSCIDLVMIVSTTPSWLIHHGVRFVFNEGVWGGRGVVAGTFFGRPLWKAWGFFLPWASPPPHARLFDQVVVVVVVLNSTTFITTLPVLMSAWPIRGSVSVIHSEPRYNRLKLLQGRVHVHSLNMWFVGAGGVVVNLEAFIPVGPCFTSPWRSFFSWDTTRVSIDCGSPRNDAARKVFNVCTHNSTRG